MPRVPETLTRRSLVKHLAGDHGTGTLNLAAMTMPALRAAHQVAHDWGTGYAVNFIDREAAK
jgi:hypothetical protein